MKSKKKIKRYNKYNKKKQFGGQISSNQFRFFTVTLDDRSNKFNYFSKLSNKLLNMNLKLEKFLGIDTRKLDTRILELMPKLSSFIDNNHGKIGDNYYTTYQSKILKREGLGSLGTCLSHFYIYKTMVEEKIPYMCIFEEDAIINDDFRIKLDKLLKNTPDDWDIIYLGMSCDYSHDDRCHQNDNINEVKPNLFKIKYAYGTYGYIINLSGVKKILPNIYPIWWHVDTLLSNLMVQNKINAYSYIPNIIFHPGTFKISSNNYTMHMDYDGYESSLKTLE